MRGSYSTRLAPWFFYSCDAFFIWIGFIYGIKVYKNPEHREGVIIGKSQGFPGAQ